MIIMSLVGYMLNSYYTASLINYPVGEQFRDWAAYLVVSIFMGFAVSMIGLIDLPNYQSTLLLQIFTGTVIYFFLCRLFRLEAFMEIWSVG